MKIKYEFDLPEEQEAYDVYKQSGKMRDVLWSFDQNVLRPMRKHGAYPKDVQTPEEMADYIDRKFWELMREYGVEL